METDLAGADGTDRPFRYDAGPMADAAAELFARVLDLRNNVDLLSEQLSLSVRHLNGNFPRTLTHLGVVNAGLGRRGPVLRRGGG